MMRYLSREETHSTDQTTSPIRKEAVQIRVGGKQMAYCKLQCYNCGIYHGIWCQEYQENESNLVVEDVSRSQTVNLFGCKNSTVQIKGKVNAVTIGNKRLPCHLVESN